MPYRLTAEIQEKIVQYVRAGGFEWVAAEAAGVPRGVFLNWLRRGTQSRRQPYRGFRDAVFQARAQARLKAEMETRAKSPRDWLRLGPGRERPGMPGWTNPAKAGTAAVDSGSSVDTAEMRRLIAVLLDVVTAYPELRVRMVNALGERHGATEED